MMNVSFLKGEVNAKLISLCGFDKVRSSTRGSFLTGRSQDSASLANRGTCEVVVIKKYGYKG